VNDRVASERLRAWLDSWRPGAGLASQDAAALSAYRDSSRLHALRAAARDPGDPDAAGLARLTAAVDALGDALGGAEATALEGLRALLEAPLLPHPLDAAPERFGARLARAQGDLESAARFAERADAYETAFASAAALEGVGALHLVPSLAAGLVPDTSAATTAWQPVVAPSTFVAHAASREATTRAYVVTVRHQSAGADPRFAVYGATLSDITDVDEPLPSQADLVLAFTDDAAAMLRRLDPERLELRLVFDGSSTYDAFSSLSGSLRDVEPAPSEGRLYLRLRVPAAWRAAGITLDAIWSNLESCVLLGLGEA